MHGKEKNILESGKWTAEENGISFLAENGTARDVPVMRL